MSKTSTELIRHALNGPTMGTRWSALFFAVPGFDTGPVQAALQQATDEVDAQMSTWNPDSDLMRLNRTPAGASAVVPDDLARVLALGADWGNAARGFMFALGCIQSQSCHTDKCPTGVATQDPRRQEALDVPDKAARVQRFHEGTLHALKDLLAAAGLAHPDQLGPEHVIRRLSSHEVRSLAALYSWVKPGELLAGGAEHAVFQRFWALSTPDSFEVPVELLSLRQSRSN